MNYCYVSLLFPNNNKCDYLEGIILAGLGLRKQKVKYPLICLITHDVPKDIREKILIIWDKVIEIPYISPNQGIIINKNIFNPDYFKNNHPYLKVFTKLHIFNKDILNYDKVLFIDSDFIPLKDFDIIFDNYDTPAGWLELVKPNFNKTYQITWGEQPFLDNEIIDKSFTDQKYGPHTINAGLLLISPDNQVYNNLINKLQQQNEYNSIDFNGNKVNYLVQLEQAFLSLEFSGKWHYINHYYNSWGYHNDNCKSLHMAGLFYTINGKKIYAKTWQIQKKQPDIFNTKTNEIANWGFDNYPEIKNILFKNLKII